MDLESIRAASRPRQKRPSVWPVLLLVLAATIFWQCEEKTTGPAYIPEPPLQFIDSVSPADGAVNVPVNSCIRITFLRSMDTATMVARRFHFTGEHLFSLSRDSMKVVICAAGGLDYAAEYHVEIDSGLADTAGNVMTKPYSFSFRTVTGNSLISLVSPANGDTAVRLDAPITATFTREMDVSTLNAATVLLSDGIDGTISYTNRRLVFTPADSLEPYHTYTMTLKASIADTAGNTLGQDFTWSFMTLKAGNGFIESVYPVDGAIQVPIGATPYIQFSTAIDPASVQPEEFTISGGVTGVVSVQGIVTSSISFNPTPDFDYATAYTAMFRGDIMSTKGESIHIDRTWSFTTEDTVPPQVVSTSPPDGAVAVPNKTNVSITFDQDIEPTGIGVGALSLLGYDSEYDRITVSGATVTLDPNDIPLCSQEITAVFDGDVSDRYGHSTHIDYMWHFTTYSAFDTATCHPTSNEGCFPPDSPIRLAFSRILDTAAVTAADVMIQEEGGDTLSGTLSGHDSIVEFTPDIPFTPLHTYRITILTGIKDAYGDNFPVPRLWCFSAKGENLLPLAVGNKWIYQVKEATYPIQSFDGAILDSIAIVADTVIEGEKWFVDQNGCRYAADGDRLETTFQVEYPYTPYGFVNSGCDHTAVAIETDQATYLCQPFIVSFLAGYRNYRQGYNFAPNVGLVRYDREFWGGVAVEPHQYRSWRLVSHQLR